MSNNLEYVFSEKLDNGIRVVGDVMPYFDSVSIGVWVKAGTVYENDDERGISHFIEHMLFKGTEKRSAMQIATEIDRVGGNINAFTSKECTCFYTKLLSEDLELGVDILSDMIYNSLFNDEDIEREKGVVCEEILMNEDTPDDVAMEEVMRIFYANSPIAYPVLGSKESVMSFDAKKIRDYMKRTYCSGNIVIACAGNFDKDRLMNCVREKFNGKPEPETKNVELGSYVNKKQFSEIKKDIEQAHICISLPGAQSRTPLSYAINILSSILGGATSSRLFQSIREERGLAYSVYSYTMSFRSTGNVSIYAGTGEKQAEQVVEIIIDELKRLRRDGVTSEEFIRSKNQARVGFIMGRESVGAHAMSIGREMLAFNELYSAEEALKRIEAVTEKDVNEAVMHMTDLSSMSGVIVSRKNDNSRIRELIMNA